MTSLQKMADWRVTAAAGMMAAAALLGSSPGRAADIYDAAVQHAGRPADDVKRDELDHPAEILRLAGIKPGMKVADILAADGYYSELLSYVVGPKGHVLLINNAAFDHWSDGGYDKRLANQRLPNVEHVTIDLNKPGLAPGSLDAIFLIKVYHDLYWVNDDPGNPWPKIDVKTTLDELVRALKPNGEIVLVDHSAKPGTGSSDASSIHRIDEAYAIKDFESRGMKVVGKSDVLRRPDDPRTKVSYKGPMLGKTDRFVLILRKQPG